MKASTIGVAFAAITAGAMLSLPAYAEDSGDRVDRPLPKHGDTKTMTLPGGAAMEMIYCAPGEFTMGCDTGADCEKPVHKVMLTQGFWLGKYEVTWKQWRSVMGRKLPSGMTGKEALGQDDKPVEGVSMSDCGAFISKVNALLDCRARLPTEAEWEYACKAGTDDAGTDGVGGATQGLPNAWGFHDMLGNVGERCMDRVSRDSYLPSSTTGGRRSSTDFRLSPLSVDPLGDDAHGRAVVRGCNCQKASSKNERQHTGVRPSCRFVEVNERMAEGRKNVGFRLCCSGRPSEPESGTTRTLSLPGGMTLEMIYCPPGEFIMGSDDGFDNEKPARKVRITQGFWLGKYEVTWKQWCAVMGSELKSSKTDVIHVTPSDKPITCVTWDDYQVFISKVRDATKCRIRLPTEAEWEYACKAGAYDDHPVKLKDVAWYDGNTRERDRIHPVGQKYPNAWGFHDMLGNVPELCLDTLAPYSPDDVSDPLAWCTPPHVVRKGKTTAVNWLTAVLRGGGSWYSARECRPSARSFTNRDSGWGWDGIRLCCSSLPTANDVQSPSSPSPSLNEEQEKLVAELEAGLKKMPRDVKLRRRYAEMMAVKGDWKAALVEFAKLGDKTGMAAKAEMSGKAKPERLGDFWWNYKPAENSAAAATKAHAVELYERALADGKLKGRVKKLAEQRVADKAEQPSTM